MRPYNVFVEDRTSHWNFDKPRYVTGFLQHKDSTACEKRVVREKRWPAATSVDTLSDAIVAHADQDEVVNAAGDGAVVFQVNNSS